MAYRNHFILGPLGILLVLSFSHFGCVSITNVNTAENEPIMADIVIGIVLFCLAGASFGDHRTGGQWRLAELFVACAFYQLPDLFGNATLDRLADVGYRTKSGNFIATYENVGSNGCSCVGPGGWSAS